MNCLQCKDAVPMVRSLIRRRIPFCCDAHRDAYQAETQRLMLARLMETRDRYAKGRTREVGLATQRQILPQEEICTGIALRTLLPG
jgi:hypothetical protein